MGFFPSAKAPQLATEANARLVRYSANDIIKKLTEIREGNYRMLLVNQVSESEYAKIKGLVLNLGSRILDSTIGTKEKSEAQANFNTTIEAFFKSKSKFAIVSFSAQLLQYFTIVSDSKFDANTSLEEFVGFLKANETKFGKTDQNLFIAEYKLIKAYNDLCVYTDATTGKIAPIADVDKKFNFLLAELSKSRAQVDKWTEDAPDHAFVQYLNFAVNYSCAKALELQYQMNKKDLAVEEVQFLEDSQKVFLAAAGSSLNTINSLNAAKEEHSQTMVAGSEFSLGQNVLIKIPAEDLTALQSHVSSLMK